MASTKSMNLTRGPVFKQLIIFTVPIFLTAFLQQLYHAADVMVVGRFAQDAQASLAAVGSTTNITNLFVNLFVGLSVGSNVTVAQAFGERNREREQRIIATSISLAVTAGVFLALVGFILTPYLLRLMNVPQDVMSEATVYMRIILLGQPASLLFNFCAGIFRARGNAKRSFRILSLTGILNVVLNLIFVLIFHWDAAGVAFATVLASVTSALIAVWILFYPLGEFKMTAKNVRFHKKEFYDIIRIGLPAGMNAILFNVSSVIVATAANALGKVVVASVSAANSVTHVFNTVGASVGTATTSFAGQNVGAGKLRRVDEVAVKAILCAEMIHLITNIALTLFPSFFLGFFTTDPEVIELGKIKLLLTAWGYMFFTVTHVFTACDRSFGKSMTPTAINIACVCFLRIAWVLGVYPFLEQNVLNLYTCIPLSWGASALMLGVNFLSIRKRTWEKFAREGKLCPEDARYYELRKKEKAKK